MLHLFFFSTRIFFLPRNKSHALFVIQSWHVLHHFLVLLLLLLLLPKHDVFVFSVQSSEHLFRIELFLTFYVVFLVFFEQLLLPVQILSSLFYSRVFDCTIEANGPFYVLSGFPRKAWGALLAVVVSSHSMHWFLLRNILYIILRNSQNTLTLWPFPHPKKPPFPLCQAPLPRSQGRSSTVYR